MNTPPGVAPRSSTKMTPELWRAVDAVLQAALTYEPSQRAAFIAEACADNDALRAEVASLLAAHVEAADAGDDFLERPAIEIFAPREPPAPLFVRLAKTLEGRYEVQRELARGGMATVYLARDVRHRRPVAIKVLREELAAAIGGQRFLEEIRVTASLQHPHILPLFDSGGGEADGLLWYVMPYVDGETLRTRLAREGRLPIHVALQLVREMADALEYAHQRGVIHRDVKPENVLLQGGHALVADFGIALALERAGGDRLTRTGITLGTPQYMAPEQATGERAVDARTDVYALGAVLHEMVAGEPPFAAESRQAVLRRMLSEPVTALATRRADVSPWLDEVVQKALEKRPEARHPSAAAFAAALDQPFTQRVETPKGRVVSARFVLYVAAVMVAVGLIGGIALARSSLLQPLKSAMPAPVRPATEPWTQPVVAQSGVTLTLYSRGGQAIRGVEAERPWTPRFSRDGRLVAYGAFGSGRTTSDIWVTDVETGKSKRLTDDDADSNDPQWSPDDRTVLYSVAAPGGKDLRTQRLDDGAMRDVARREGMQFASDWTRDGKALLVTEQGRVGNYDIIVQPVDGSAAWAYVATNANETAARISPNGRWVAYTSDESGRAEVYVDSYPRPGRRIALSWDGGLHPVWREDGKALYYWHDGALMELALADNPGGKPPTAGERRVLFRAKYLVGPNTMYDVSPDGTRFIVVEEGGR